MANIGGGYRGALFFLLLLFMLAAIVTSLNHILSPDIEDLAMGYQIVDRSGPPPQEYTPHRGRRSRIRTEDNPRSMSIKDIVYVTKPQDIMAEVYADDCVKSVVVNGKRVFKPLRCRLCEHCEGVTVDLSGHLRPGNNTVLFEVLNVGGPAEFYLKWATRGGFSQTWVYAIAGALGAAILILLYRMRLLKGDDLEYLPLLLVLFAAAHLMLPRLDTYSYSELHTRFNFIVHDRSATNHLEKGFLGTKLGMMTSPKKPSTMTYYVNHPPLLALFTAMSYIMFLPLGWGHRAAATVVPTLFSFASVATLYLIGKRLWNDGVAFLCAAAMVATPMFRRFCQLLNFETPVTFFILLALYFYILWMQTGRDRHFFGMYSAIVFGCFSEWPAYYLLVFIGAHHILFSGKRGLRRVLLLFTTGIMCFMVFLVHVYVLEGSDGIDEIARASQKRSGLAGGGGLETGISWRLERLRESAGNVAALNTPYLTIASLLFLADIIYRICRRLDITRESYVLVLLSVGVAQTLLAPEAIKYHDYWLYYFTPALSLAAASIAYQVVQSLKKSLTPLFLVRKA
jgi:hypothetical protein